MARSSVFQTFRKITARFNSSCSECGCQLTKGDTIYWMKRGPVLCSRCYGSPGGCEVDPGVLAEDQWLASAESECGGSYNYHQLNY